MINSLWALVITEIHFYAGIHFPTQPLQQTKHYLQDEGWNYPLLYKFPTVLKAMWQPWCEWEYRESQCQILLWTSSTIWHCPLAHGEWEVAASSQHALLYFSLGNSITHTHIATCRLSCTKSTPRRCSSPSGATLPPVPTWFSHWAAAWFWTEEVPALLWDQAAQYFVFPCCWTCGSRPYLLHASQTLFSNANFLMLFFLWHSLPHNVLPSQTLINFTTCLQQQRGTDGLASSLSEAQCFEHPTEGWPEASLLQGQERAGILLKCVCI